MKVLIQDIDRSDFIPDADKTADGTAVDASSRLVSMTANRTGFSGVRLVLAHYLNAHLGAFVFQVLNQLAQRIIGIFLIGPLGHFLFLASGNFRYIAYNQGSDRVVLAHFHHLMGGMVQQIVLSMGCPMLVFAFGTT